MAKKSMRARLDVPGSAKRFRPATAPAELTASINDHTVLRGMSDGQPLVIRGLQEVERPVVGVCFDHVECRQSKFRDVNFIACEFRSMMFQECELNGCAFDSRRLRLIDGDSQIGDVLRFIDCDIEKVAFQENSIVVRRKDNDIKVELAFIANFIASRIKQLTVPRGSVWLHCRGAALRDCNFNKRRVIGGSFHASTISNCSFEKSDLSRINFGGCDAVDTSFAKSDLSGAVLHGRFKNCSFRGADLRSTRMAPRKSEQDENHVRFINCDFRDAKFDDANLFGARFVRCRIRDKKDLGAKSKYAEFR